MLELRNLILQTGTGSFNDYRLRATQSKELSDKINTRIKNFFKQINKLFENTNKKIEIDFSTKSLMYCLWTNPKYHYILVGNKI